MQGKATVAGHPVHPLLVTFPIGSYVAAVIADIVYVSGGSSFWGTMSMWLIAFGIAGSLLAALFGFVDYLSAPMSAQARRVANDLAHVHLVGSSEGDVGTARVAADADAAFTQSQRIAREREKARSTTKGSI